MNTIIGLLIGVCAGLHTSTWGMYKDAPHEGFTYPKYFRSTWVGAILGVAAYPFVRLDFAEPGNIVVYFGLIYVLERGVTEFYKTFLREESQAKYFIPMQFAIFGRVIENRGKRLLIGFFYAAAVILAFLAVLWLDLHARGEVHPAVVVGIASVGGWISAFGGAWKDAPVEGFETFKFFRSPALAALYGVLIASFTTSLALIALSALGYTVATLETYKTFFFPNKPRGKFSGKPILFPEMVTRRYRFVPIYAAIWVAIIASFLWAFGRAHTGILTVI